MPVKHYKKSVKWVEKNRFQLLLLATILVLVLPAISGTGVLSEIFLIASMSFLFIQSIFVASSVKKKGMEVRHFIVLIMILIFWLSPVGLRSRILDILRLSLVSLFFIFVTFYLFKFIRRSTHVDIKVIITAINIYLLIGIITGSLSFLLFMIFPEAYNLPAYIQNPKFPTFVYYSFITMSTVGYGDITPRIPETQTLAYLTAVTGQLYVGIIIAFLVGKFMVSAERAKESKQDG